MNNFLGFFAVFTCKLYGQWNNLLYCQKPSGIKGETLVLNGNICIAVTVGTFLIELTFVMHWYMNSAIQGNKIIQLYLEIYQVLIYLKSTSNEHLSCNITFS
jgi:hypothetical protein